MMVCEECGGRAKAKEEECASCDGEGNAKKVVKSEPKLTKKKK